MSPAKDVPHAFTFEVKARADGVPSYVNPGRQRVLLDRELYVPESWFADPGRMADAGVSEGEGIEIKPKSACRMIERPVTTRCWSSGWVTGNEPYGDSP